MIIKRTLLIMVMMSNHALAHEYLYPVAGVKKNNERYLYLLYQKDPTHLELFLWHEKTKIISKALPSSCIPASVRILPDQKGFSFIDNGRIKLKLFNKRSPKAIDFHEPIYQVELIEWIDSQNFYFCAKENGTLGIFHADRDGALYRICLQSTADCMYPQKVENSLFYIERTNQLIPHYAIKRMAYPEILYEKSNFNAVHNFDKRVEQLLQLKNQGYNHQNNLSVNQAACLYASDKPLAFLRMTSADEGYFVQYADTIHSDDKSIRFEYHRLMKDEHGWKTSFLFYFDIPLLFLQEDSGSGYSYRSENPHKIHESILPLLPCHDDNEIYYMSASDDDHHIGLYSYTKETQHITKHNQHDFLHDAFGMVKLDDTIFYGGALHYHDNKDHGRFLYKTQPDGDLPLGMWINSDGFVCYDQPTLIRK